MHADWGLCPLCQFQTMTLITAMLSWLNVLIMSWPKSSLKDEEGDASQALPHSTICVCVLVELHSIDHILVLLEQTLENGLE